jgi:hypothetical protein
MKIIIHSDSIDGSRQYLKNDFTLSAPILLKNIVIELVSEKIYRLVNWEVLLVSQIWEIAQVILSNVTVLSVMNGG